MTKVGIIYPIIIFSMKERILKINDKEIHVVASEPLEEESAENIYFMVQLDELGEQEVTPFTEVYI